MPRLTFVIPFYEKYRTIEKCLKSLLDQSEKDIEIILVKDGPADLDKLLKPILKKAKGKLKVIEIHHKGACAARNEGFRASKGDYISFWDADSYIKPDAAKVWLQTFDKYPKADFVYSGYEFPEGYGAVGTEAFDPWLLKVNNYISGHFPVKRAMVPEWDEYLVSLQDWDFWLQIAEKGGKGVYNRGYAFKTEAPDRRSISGIGCSPENWLPRRKIVMEKHGIKSKKVCVSALGNRAEGIALAKLIDADYRDLPTHNPHEYETIIQVGFDPKIADQHAQVFSDPNVKKVLFWKGKDVNTLQQEVSLAASQALVKVLNGAVHYQFCEDKESRDILRGAGFKAVMFPLPLEPEEMKPLPKDFKVLVDVAENFKFFFDGVIRACPDIEFVPFKGSVNVDEFSLYLQFQHHHTLEAVTKQVLLSGRRVISNVQAPYCGFISDTVDLEDLRKSVIRKIRVTQDLTELNLNASKHYTEACSPEKFSKTLNEVVGAK